MPDHVRQSVEEIGREASSPLASQQVSYSMTLGRVFPWPSRRVPGATVSCNELSLQQDYDHDEARPEVRQSVEEIGREASSPSSSQQGSYSIVGRVFPWPSRRIPGATVSCNEHSLQQDYDHDEARPEVRQSVEEIGREASSPSSSQQVSCSIVGRVFPWPSRRIPGATVSCNEHSLQQDYDHDEARPEVRQSVEEMGRLNSSPLASQQGSCSIVGRVFPWPSRRIPGPHNEDSLYALDWKPARVVVPATYRAC
jgi:hypothetical protein